MSRSLQVSNLPVGFGGNLVPSDYMSVTSRPWRSNESYLRQHKYFFICPHSAFPMSSSLQLNLKAFMYSHIQVSVLSATGNSEMNKILRQLAVEFEGWQKHIQFSHECRRLWKGNHTS